MNFGGDSMIINAIRFRNINIGNLPQLSYILLKPDPLGTEFKKFACYVTGDLIFIELI